MAFNFLVNENTAAGLINNPNGPQSGVDDIDSDFIIPEKNLFLPYLVDPLSSWLAYACWIECELDAGVALHKPLPQRTTVPDTLASGNALDYADLANTFPGVNTVSQNVYQDVAQQMATPTYIFKLRGYAMRAIYQIPIPGLVTVCGVTPIPAERQTAYNQLIGNSFGVQIYRARWDLWYYVTLPPRAIQAPPDNLAERIQSLQTPPQYGLSTPDSFPDWNAVPSIPTTTTLQGFGTVGQVKQGG